jgi:hypothetical protein
VIFTGSVLEEVLASLLPVSEELGSTTESGDDVEQAPRIKLLTRMIERIIGKRCFIFCSSWFGVFS